jgi:hypothetical protein
MTLYEHVGDFHALQALIDETMRDEDGNIKELDDSTKEAISALADQWKDDFKGKLDRICKFRANIIADADECLAQAKILQDEADRLKERGKAHIRKVEGLNFLMMTAMERIPLTKVETALFMVWIQKNPPKMVIHDESKISASYFKVIPETLELEKQRLKKDLVDGVKVEWVKPKAEPVEGEAVETVDEPEEMTLLPGAIIVQEKGLRVK